MPSLQTARRASNAKNNGTKTIGQIYKEQSNFAMEQTWNSDPQAKIAYIYDYFHDDFLTKYDKDGVTPLFNYTLKDGMTYENTNKTKVDAKFIVKSYQSMDKDQVEYYLQFKPSQPFYFNEGDDLYYYETDFRKRYGSAFPVGLFCDLPDDKGIYHKWLICRDEPANQFPKFLILPVNYELMWVEQNGKDRIKRRMWSVLRQQQSYTSGVYVDRYFGHTDNQGKIWLPMNSITENIWYTNEDSKNMRVIVSALMKRPCIWKITKCESASPLGLQKLTIYSDFFNEYTDYVNLETGEMYADYYDTDTSDISPSEPLVPSPTLSSITAKILASTPTIKVGGSYKSLIVNLYNNSNDDITAEYLDAEFIWSCSINDEDWTDKVVWRNGVGFNQIKAKFPNDSSVIGKNLSVKCVINKDNLPIESETMQFGLIE